ncbi:MAG TPA: hypothetical protein VGV87_12690 [Blastocatellia bacterium]|nr:hypothetical protein [Blastocatellia bacterium]
MSHSFALERRRMSRRRFLWSTASGLGAMAVMSSPAARMAADGQTGCDYLKDLADNWNIVRPMLASRYHRLQHCFFHYVRNNWSGLSDQQQEGIKALNWAAPRAALDKAAWDKRAGRTALFWATDNGSGEDFLFYHRWMIAMVNEVLAKKGKGPIQPWSDKDAIPPPKGGCPDEQVPDFTPRFENASDPKKPIDIEWLQLRVKEMKAPGFFWSKMNWWGQDFRDRGYLKSMTLGELGARLEMGVHNQMHVRWSAYPSGGSRLIRDEPDFRVKWDGPEYDTLFDEYSSHVGPIFYRLHKWIDNRIEDWAEAHGREVVRASTPHGFDWFQRGRWVDVVKPWTGAWGFEHSSPDEEKKRVAIMLQVKDIMFPPETALLRVTPAAREQRIISLRDMIM